MRKILATQISNCFKRGNKLLICGCGGSAAEAQHFAGELVCTFEHPRRALPAIALTTDTSILTAWSNDYDFSDVFRRQVEALGLPGDVLVVLSTSGKSESVLKAITEARSLGLEVISWPRRGKTTAKIQEYQLKVIHDVCRLVEREFL